AAVACGRELRADVSAGCRPGVGSTAGRLRRETDPDRALPLRIAADLREHGRGLENLSGRGPGGGERDGDECPAEASLSRASTGYAIDFRGNSYFSGDQYWHRDPRLDGRGQGPRRGDHRRAALQQHGLRPAGRPRHGAHGRTSLRWRRRPRAAALPDRPHRLTARTAPALSPCDTRLKTRDLLNNSPDYGGRRRCYNAEQKL